MDSQERREKVPYDVRVDLVGRDAELADVIRRVRNGRLVTITGPGGIGKTRLAREVAVRVGPDFEYGSVEVDLTRIDREDGVAEAVAGQLGYADFGALVNSTGDQPTLVVLDNCEHVLDAAADVTRQLLDACEMPTIIATSRSPLDLPDESVITLGPLATPPLDVTDGAIDAVRLLRERARDHGADPAAIGDETAAEIARRLDGVPLAIEIAAARLRSMTPIELLDALDAGALPLSRPRFRGRQSHRSVVAMVEWSTDLLAPSTRDAFFRLGVFAGPFTSTMALAIIDAEPDGSEAGDHDDRDRLEALVDSSLVVADTTAARTWYRLLHPVRAVALDRLRRRGELATIESRWVDHVVEMALGIVASGAAGWSDILGDLLALYDNLIAALRWTIDHDDDGDRALLLLAVLWGIVHQSHTAEIAGVGESVIDRWGDRTRPYWPDAAATVATCRNLLGDPAGAIALAESTMPFAEISVFAPATLRRVLAQAHRAIGEPEAACAHFLAAAEAAREQGLEGFALELLADHGLLLAETYDIDAGVAIIDEVHAQAVGEGASVNAAWALACRGAAIAIRDPGAASIELERALAAAREIAYPAGVSFSLRALAAARADTGDDVGAARALLELADELLQRGGLNDLRMVLDTAAVLLERRGDPSWADLAATARSLPVTSVGTPVDHEVFDRAESVGSVLTVRDALSVCKRDLRALVDTASGWADSDSPGATRAPTPEHGIRSPAGEATASGRGAADRTASAALAREGDVWRISFGGNELSLRHSKGLADLANLLRSPGREWSALDLMGAVVVGSDGDEVIDAEARRQYEARVRELQSEIDEAEANNDIGRAERLGTELDELVDHLTAALGLAGRARRSGGESERARSAVTQRIRTTIKRIGEHDEALGTHLRSSVRTGTFCSYAPVAPIEWSIAE